MKLYKHVYNSKAEIKTIEFEVTETPKLYIVIDRDLFNFVWERQIKKEDIGKFNGKAIHSYNMITTTPDATPFIKALIDTEEDFERYLKKEIEASVHRKTQLLKLLDDDTDDIYDGTIINCPVCGKEITVEFNTARCDKCDWFAADAELHEIMKEE